MVTVGGLFSGIGGIELGFEKADLRFYGLMNLMKIVIRLLDII